MKNLTTAIYGKLAGSDLHNDIAGRMYKGRAPENATYPYVVYMIVSNGPEYTYSEDFEDVIIQFSLFSSDSDSTEVEDMFTHLKSLYDECALSVTGYTWLYWMKRVNATLQPEDHTTTSGTIQVWAYHVDYEIKLQET